ncbi:POT family-domain-containing protein [Xylariomycetidae sp. FL2044]|nr:POT family-domain-containing protein [Xylariomycetidae sp. FL2044]
MPMEQEELAVMAEARRPSVVVADPLAKEKVLSTSESVTEDGFPEPTEEELQTLRRISGPINWQAFTVAFVEFCERFSWYGTTAVYVNFIQQPRPGESRTGAIVYSQECYDTFGIDACHQAGGLGQGQQASTGLSTFNQFWAYLMPLVGGWIADTYLGRYMTIQWSILVALIGHAILVVSSIPSVMDHPSSALGAFSVGVVIMGMGTGGFKSNISPLIAEQIAQTRPYVLTLPSGERVIQDPQVTLSRVFLYFYMMINFGSLAGGIGMVYAERNIGFWLAFAMPTFAFLLCPLVLIPMKKRYRLSPPTGSVLSKAFSVLVLASKGCFSWNPVQMYKNFQRPSFWDDVKPSHLGSNAPAWMAGLDDAWVDQVARGFGACKVFTWTPLYWLAYGQMTNNLTSMSATMTLNGVPNDLINNLNPISLVIFIPIVDFFVYPALRKMKIRFTPIKRMAWGFFIASAAMISSTVLQYYIYKTSACPDEYVSAGTFEGIDCTAPLNVWIQAVPYVLIGFSEIFTSITGLEYAVSKAPENMRGLVMGVNLVMNAFSSALSQAFLPLLVDPLLTWNYGIVAILAFVGGVGFWLTWRSLDAREDELNLIQATKYKGRGAALADEEKF